ncbi:mechanosensitive ion channel [Candidatus Woesearchaeota archaeon]|nr:mechanosensitive ion channel [Candidatus Woesearchaeota archaeon]
MLNDLISAAELKSLAVLAFAVFLSIILLKISYFLIRRYFEKRGGRAQVKEIISIYKYSLTIVVILVLFIIFSNVFRNFLASIGVLAAGLAISLQRPILNVFGWLTIVLKKPYAIGDRVCIGTSKGDVYDINIMHTNMSELQDDAPSGRTISVPNEFVLTQAVTNYTKGTPYIWDTLSIVVDKSSDEEKAIGILKNASEETVGSLMRSLSRKWTLTDGKKVDLKPEVSMEIVVLNGASAIQLTSRYLCDIKERKSVRSRMYDLIIAGLKNAREVALK